MRGYLKYTLIVISFSFVCSAVVHQQAVCGVPPHSKVRNTVLAAVQEAGFSRQLLTSDDDINHAPGALAAYTCINHQDYKLIGCPAITCLLNGTWSGSQPKCELLENVNSSSHQTEVQCGQPPISNTTAKSYYLTKTVMVYHCNKSQQLDGCAVLICNTSNGSWIGSPPSCIQKAAGTTEVIDIEVIIRPMGNQKKPVPYNTTRGAFDPLTTSPNFSPVHKEYATLVLLPLLSYLIF